VFKTFFLSKEIILEIRRDIRDMKEALLEIEHKLHFLSNPRSNAILEIDDGLLGTPERDRILKMLRDYLEPNFLEMAEAKVKESRTNDKEENEK